VLEIDVNDPDFGELIARKLSEVWLFFRTPEFLQYLLLTYKKSVAENPAFEKICIAEAENGEIESSSIGGIIKRWWVVDDRGCRRVKKPDLVLQDAEFFDSHPIVKFYLEADQIVIGERFGPDLICRKRGTISGQPSGFAIDKLAVTWTCNT